MDGRILATALATLRSYALCDSCLGRQYATLGYRLTNRERGRSIKIALLMEAEASEDIEVIRILSSKGMLPEASATLQRRGVNPPEPQACFVCGGVSDKLQNIASRIVDMVSGYEFNSFVVGIVVPGWVSEREDIVRSISSSTYCEGLKSEFSRELGKLLSSMLGVVFDPYRPDMNVIVDPFSVSIDISPTPLYLAGRFRKLKPGLPIRSRICRVCMGGGCALCGGLGVKETSVEYIFRKVSVELYRCESVKLHVPLDDGRDRVVLGLGRRFVLEVRKPRRRSIDLDLFKERLDSSFEGLIDVNGLSYVDRGFIRRMKTSFESEGYILLLKPVESMDISEAAERLKYLEGLRVKQRYPGFKARLKVISDVSVKFREDGLFELRFISSEPLHTKSFIEGGRDTKPTVMEVTGIAWLLVDTLIYVGGVGYA
ncbi:MAG: tRNA pseudouridine(54/55) synthase Pus10 [Candidatus Bathyarchaeota archaeon]|nr:tRNA pseudouridine(54/55) synthase Pus10 [Candidatus Bathyarchaeota archaeon]